MKLNQYSTLYVYAGSVLEPDVEVVVNAANQSLLGGGGVDGAIHQAAGPNLLKECRTLKGCKTGEAKVTLGYNLKAKYIVHTVGPIYSGDKEDPVLLRSCYIKSLDLAGEKKAESIGFPCISAGVYGYPLKEASVIAVSAVKDWFKEHPDVKMDVYLCCFNSKEYSIYMETIGEK